RDRASVAERFPRETLDRFVARSAELVPDGAVARIAGADDEVADVKVEMRRLVRALGNAVDVDVERPRRERMQRTVEPRLLVRFAQCRRLEREVAGLDVAAGLEQAVELDMLHEARARAVAVDHEGRGGEVRSGLVARERI